MSVASDKRKDWTGFHWPRDTDVTGQVGYSTLDRCPKKEKVNLFISCPVQSLVL